MFNLFSKHPQKVQSLFNVDNIDLFHNSEQAPVFDHHKQTFYATSNIPTRTKRKNKVSLLEFIPDSLFTKFRNTYFQYLINNPFNQPYADDELVQNKNVEYVRISLNDDENKLESSQKKLQDIYHELSDRLEAQQVFHTKFKIAAAETYFDVLLNRTDNNNEKKMVCKKIATLYEDLVKLASSNKKNKILASKKQFYDQLVANFKYPREKSKKSFIQTFDDIKKLRLQSLSCIDHKQQIEIHKKLAENYKLLAQLYCVKNDDQKSLEALNNAKDSEIFIHSLKNMLNRKTQAAKEFLKNELNECITTQGVIFKKERINITKFLGIADNIYQELLAKSNNQRIINPKIKIDDSDVYLDHIQSVFDNMDIKDLKILYNKFNKPYFREFFDTAFELATRGSQNIIKFKCTYDAEQKKYGFLKSVGNSYNLFNCLVCAIHNHEPDNVVQYSHLSPIGISFSGRNIMPKFNQNYLNILRPIVEKHIEEMPKQNQSPTLTK